MNKQIIPADHLNATHLGKRITISSLHGTVVSGKLKEICADYAIVPSFTSSLPSKEDVPKRLVYRKDVHVILHLSNQVNDDIKAIVHEDTELQVEDEHVDHFVNVFGKMVRLEKETQ